MTERVTAVAACAALWLAAAIDVRAAAPALSMPEERTVELAADTDADQWAARNGIEDFEKLPVAGGGAILRFSMEESLWRPRSTALCTDRGVVACSTDFCQSDFAPANESATPRVTLQRRAPDLAILFGETAPTAGDPTKVPGAQSCSVGSANPLAEATQPGVAPATGTAGPAARDLATREDGTIALPDAPDALDRGCWEVVRTNACEMRVRPLSDLLPEYEPKRLLALVALAANQPNGIDAAAITAIAALAGAQVLETTPLPSIGSVLVRLQVADGAVETAVALALLQAAPGVQSAQYEFRYQVSTSHNDPYAWMNYGARLIGADQLFDVARGEGATVAVIDTGVDTAHPELAARVIEQLDVSGFGVSADRHGTAIAGLIAGEADNSLGAYGMAPAARVLAIKACQPESKTSASARCWSSALAKALDLAIRRDARIINMSLAGPDDPIVRKVVDAALAGQRLVIAAAGNGGPEAGPSFPAAHPGVVAVTAIDSRSRLYSAATRGDFIDLAAPGVEVPVPVPNETYPGQLSGTSMAAAHASGVAALLLGRNPAAKADELRAALESGARPVPVAANTGRGRIDACASAKAMASDTEVCGPAVVAQATAPPAASATTPPPKPITEAKAP
jgi:subtilase family protein